MCNATTKAKRSVEWQCRRECNEIKGVFGNKSTGIRSKRLNGRKNSNKAPNQTKLFANKQNEYTKSKNIKTVILISHVLFLYLGAKAKTVCVYFYFSVAIEQNVSIFFVYQ